MNGTRWIHVAMIALHPAAWGWTVQWHEQQRFCRGEGKQREKYSDKRHKKRRKNIYCISRPRFTTLRALNAIAQPLCFTHTVNSHGASELTFPLLIALITMLFCCAGSLYMHLSRAKELLKTENEFIKTWELTASPTPVHHTNIDFHMCNMGWKMTLCKVHRVSRRLKTVVLGEIQYVVLSLSGV